MGWGACDNARAPVQANIARFGDGHFRQQTIQQTPPAHVDLFGDYTMGAN